MEERVFAPRVYFCERCLHPFTLDPEDIEDLQRKLRAAIDAHERRQRTGERRRSGGSAARGGPPPSTRRPELDRAPPVPAGDTIPGTGARVRIESGPYRGEYGAMAVISGGDALVRLELDGQLIRVPLADLGRL